MGLKRFQHRIKDNLKGEFPHEFLFFDTETHQNKISEDEIEHTLRLGVALYWQRRGGKRKETLTWHEFTSIDDFWDIVERHSRDNTRLVIISHNLPFDMGIVKGFAMLDKLGYTPVKLILDTRRSIWRFRRDKRSLLFLDNMNYFDLKLAVLGESMGISKMKMPAFSEDDQAWMTYCRRDVEILYQSWKIWHNFLHENDLGNFGLTISSQAFNAYRHRFMSSSIYVHTSTKGVDLERAAYRGGRNECFKIGLQKEDDYSLLDVNSMYSYVMKWKQYPTNIRSTGGAISIKKLRNALDDFAIVADVNVNIDEPCFGVKYNNRLTFPIGCFRVTLTSEELLYGLERGYIKQVHDYALYDKAPIFHDYVDFFYNKRQEFIKSGNSAYQFLCKVLLNHLYGKFGQKVDEWDYVGEDPTRIYDFWHEWSVEEQKNYAFRCLNHRVEKCIGSSEGFNSLVAVAAEVTANARLYLWDLINIAGRDNVFYCDTDSLIVNPKGRANLELYSDPIELGMLKVQKTTRHLVIYNLKDYEFGDDVKIKGVSHNAILLPDGRYKQYQSRGIKGGLHKQEVNKVIWRVVNKRLVRRYNKGIVLPSGRVKPFVLFTNINENYFDAVTMTDKYGSKATIKGQALLPEVTGHLYDPTLIPDKKADMTPEDRSQAEIDTLDKRRNGEEIYQRSK